MRTTEDPPGSVNVSTFEVNADGVEDTLDAIDIGSTVNVEPDIVRVSSPVIEALAGTVRVTTGPLGSVSVSTTKGTDILDAAVTGSTVNMEPDIVRVSSPVTESLAAKVRVTTDSPGSVSVCTIEDADPLGPVDVRELETVERDTIFEVDVPLELVEIVDSGEVEELLLQLIVVVDVKVDSELAIESVLDEVVEEKMIEFVVLELLQLTVPVVPDEEPPEGTNWRTAGARGFEKEVPARAARLKRPMICFNAIFAGRLQ